MRCPSRTPFLDLQRNGFRPAGIGLTERNIDRRFEVAAACGIRRRAPTPSRTGKERIEKIGKPAPARVAAARSPGAVAGVAERVTARRPGLGGAIALLRFGLPGGLFPIASERVVFLALLGIAEHLVRFGDLFEFLFGLDFVIGIGIGMPLLGELPIRRFDIFLGDVFGDPENLIVILVLQLVVYGPVRLATMTIAGRSKSSPMR